MDRFRLCHGVLMAAVRILASDSPVKSTRGV
jgi:hypothetical protein